MLGITLALLVGLLALSVPVAAGMGILGLALSAIYSKLPLSLAMVAISSRISGLNRGWPSRWPEHQRQ